MRRLGFLALLLLSACDRRPQTPPAPPKPPHPLPPRLTPTPVALEKHGLSFKLPPCWTSQDVPPKNGLEGNLMEFKCGAELMGSLHWQLGGSEMGAFPDTIVSLLGQKYREVNLLKRQPFQSEGLRLEVRTSNNVPDTTHWLIVYLFHRGRIYDFMLWSHAGDWHLHSQEVEDFLASIVRFHDEDNPLRSGSFVSQIYGYQLELGEHWNLVELAPADSVAESLMVARLWTGPGLPYGFIIGFKHQGTAAAYIEQHLAGLATRKQLKGAPKMPGADPEGCIEYNTAMSVLQFHHTLRVIKKGDRLFHLEIWSTLKDAAEHQDTIRRISESLKVS